jgi:hypothetical protein
LLVHEELLQWVTVRHDWHESLSVRPAFPYAVARNFFLARPAAPTARGALPIALTAGALNAATAGQV